MNKKSVLFCAIIIVVSILYGCKAAVSKTPISKNPMFERGDVLLQNDFSARASGWETSGDADYKNEKFVILAYDARTLVWALAHKPTLTNIHIEVTAQNMRGVEDASFGIICNYRDENNFYLLGAGSDSSFAIIKIVNNTPVYLTSQQAEWPKSMQIAPKAATYRLGADCGFGVLNLYVDGISIASVKDSSFQKGDVGLFAMSDEKPQAEISFDDLIVTALQEK
jgi:hypothetical protein